MNKKLVTILLLLMSLKYPTCHSAALEEQKGAFLMQDSQQTAKDQSQVVAYIRRSDLQGVE